VNRVVSLVTEAALLAAILTIAFMLHFATAIVTARRLQAASVSRIYGDPQQRPPISLIIPIAALERSEIETALSAFDILYPAFELLFCAFDEDEPRLASLRQRIAASPHVKAKLLIGRAHVSANPKLDNVEKAWTAAEAELIAMVDGNVLFPPDLIDRLLAVWDASTGLSTSAPIGVKPSGLWAEVECAFLNTFHARWQLSADYLGGGFANGKAMLLRRDLLVNRGGARGLSFDLAEDSAATKIVRAANLKVRLVDRPLEQPLGRRSMARVWRRQLRWAQLRRRSFPFVFLCECLTTAATPLLAGLGLASLVGWSLGWTLLSIATAWYGVEAALALAVGWPWIPLSFVACVIRDGMALAIWPIALVKSRYLWRGNFIDTSNQTCISASVKAL
jgi:ceramide glucosyltransferase